MLNRDPKLTKLHMGHQIGPNAVPWYDFCHTKNLKFGPPPPTRQERGYRGQSPLAHELQTF